MVVHRHTLTSPATSESEPPFIYLRQGVLDGDSISEMDMNIAPGTGTPPHVHYQFSETFLVLTGELQLNLDQKLLTLRMGDQATVPIGKAHFFQNKSDHYCHVRVTVSPGNEAFEEAMLISYGLAADGLSNRAGVPGRLIDLVLFLRLADVNAIGLAGIFQPVVCWLSRRTFARRRLAELRDIYVKTH